MPRRPAPSSAGGLLLGLICAVLAVVLTDRALESPEQTRVPPPIRLSEPVVEPGSPTSSAPPTTSPEQPDGDPDGSAEPAPVRSPSPAPMPAPDDPSAPAPVPATAPAPAPSPAPPAPTEVDDNDGGDGSAEPDGEEDG